MRASLSCWLVLSCVALSGCFIGESIDPARPCADDSECPTAYRCVPVSGDQRVCEVLYPPAPQTADAGTSDAGVTPTWCRDVQPVLAASCVASCHGTDTSGSRRSDFRLDVYETVGSVRGAGEMADRIRIRAGEGDTMPPPGSPAPSAAERSLLTRWARSGAPRCTDGGTP